VYKEHIVDKGIEKHLTALCLDNCNTMRGTNCSFMTKVSEKKPFMVFPPCLLHIINICEKTAFSFIPDEIKSFKRAIYNYFSQSL